MAPDDALNLFRINATTLENVGDAFLDGKFPPSSGNALEDVLGEVFPVFTDTGMVKGP